MDIFTLLKNDHQRVSEMIERLAHTSERSMKTRQNLFNKLKEQLKLHTRVEQRVVYNKMKPVEGDLIKEAEQEHQTVDQLLQQMSKNRKSDVEWKTQLQELRQNIEHHVQMEETEMFDRLRDEFSEDQIDAMGAQFQKAKNGASGSKTKKRAGTRTKRTAASRR